MSGKVLATLFGLLIFTSAVASAGDVSQGRSLYLRYCASCHGIKGDGHGPVAPALKTPPSDLRLLSHRYGNPLPEDQIAGFIDGRADVVAHGPREMPVWGEQVWQYPEGKGHETQVTPKVANVVAYLQSIQMSEHHASIK